MNRDPIYLAEAQAFGEVHEYNFRITMGCETEIKNRAGYVSWADNGYIHEDIATSRRVHTPQYLTTISLLD